MNVSATSGGFNVADLLRMVGQARTEQVQKVMEYVAESEIQEQDFEMAEAVVTSLGAELDAYA